MKIFDIIKASKFFPEYAPSVGNWKHKMRGASGHGIPLSFTTEDHEEICKGIKKLGRDLAENARRTRGERESIK